MKCLNVKSRGLLAGLAALAAAASMAWADPLAANLYVGTLEDLYGFDGRFQPDGSYIEFREMYKAGTGLAGWKAYSPESPWLEVRNPLKGTSEVGAGVIESARGHGLFAECVSGLEKDKRYVARVFSGPTPAESVAFCDSRPFVYTADDTQPVTNVTFGAWTAMDGTALEDTDGDGLVDLAETTLSDTDPEDWDTDGDGFSDGFEHVHGMNPKAPYFLDIRLATTPAYTDEELQDSAEEQVYFYDVAWPSISGLTYNLEFVEDIQAEDDEWIGITNVTATGTNTAVPVDEQHFNSPRGFFRVWTVLPEDAPDSGDGE